MPFFAQCDRHNFVPPLIAASETASAAVSVSSARTALSSTAHDLFPPGRFTSLSVVVIPYPLEEANKGRGHGKSGGGSGAQSNGLFIKVFKKLEKAGFDILSVTSKVMDGDMTAACQEHVLLSQASYGCTYMSHEQKTKSWFAALVGRAVLCVVVAGNSALLRLLPVVGPFDTQLAQDKYPLSISATLHAGSGSGSGSQPVRIFHSTTVAATDRMLQMFTTHSYSTAELLLAAQSQGAMKNSGSGSGSGSVTNLLSDFGSMEYHTYQERYDSPPKPSGARGIGGGVGSGSGVEHAVFRGLREHSLAEHAAWVAQSTCE